MATSRCLEGDCTRVGTHRGFCKVHYSRRYRREKGLLVQRWQPPLIWPSSPAEMFALLPERIRSVRVVTSAGCWEANSHHSGNGYVYISWNGRGRPLHRLVMEFLNRVLPSQDVDHLCRNVGCWNPDHLEGVTHAENMRRSKPATKMTCKYGHDWTDPRNVFYSRGTRRCAACNRARCAARYNARLSDRPPCPGYSRHYFGGKRGICVPCLHCGYEGGPVK